MEELMDAAEKGDAQAAIQGGKEVLTIRDCVDQDFEEAADWFRKAAEQGHVGAQYNMGVMYLDGEGLPMDVGEAVE
eukprot:CAMPEP_0177668222 /NCGR_PEP_ID=MMETSP0447-20121125/22628_1 /TAXON_ID=0 /ORGANISM="Stygamoeba regulata, Strain BSH-02190019" /LENGTH=75 /DNA_ID=CAMNT_0019174679 /DNA_START=300 /DNA_END=526 /DNA_ORIENTATION=-